MFAGGAIEKLSGANQTHEISECEGKASLREMRTISSGRRIGPSHNGVSPRTLENALGKLVEHGQLLPELGRGSRSSNRESGTKTKRKSHYGDRGCNSRYHRF